MSEAVASPAPSDTLSAMTADERSHWRLTGELPSERSTPPSDDPTPHADPSPAPPVEQAGSTEPSPPAASEPAKSKAHNAATRKAELSSEIDALLKQRHEIRQELESLRQNRPAPDVPAASSPAPAPSLAQTIQQPDLSKDPLTDAEFFEAFPTAGIGEYQRYIARYEFQSASKQAAERSQRDRKIQAFQARLGEVTADPDQAAAVAAVVNRLPCPAEFVQRSDVTPWHVLSQEIFDSAQSAALLRHFAQTPADLDRVAQLGSGVAIVREIARLETSLGVSPSAPSQPVVTKTTTSAPAPPTTLGKKPAAPVDETHAAVAAGDFARYKAEMNRREVSR